MSSPIKPPTTPENHDSGDFGNRSPFQVTLQVSNIIGDGSSNAILSRRG